MTSSKPGNPLLLLKFLTASCVYGLLRRIRVYGIRIRLHHGRRVILLLASEDKKVIDMGKPDQTKRVKKLLTEAVTLLCRSSLSFADQVTVEGLLGITLDKTDILLISIHETIKQTISSKGGKSGRDFKSDESPSPKRRKSKKKRRRSSSSEETEESDEDQDVMGQGRDFALPPGVFPGMVGPDGQIHPVSFHGEGYHGDEQYDTDTAQGDLEIKEEKFSDEDGECFMVEGEEDDMKGHPEMGYVQGGPGFSQVHAAMLYPLQAGPSNVHQFQGKGVHQVHHGPQPGQMTPQQQPTQIFKCNFCSKTFKWEHNLQKHMQEEHSGAKVHKCTWCDKVLASDTSLKRHMRKVHGMTKEGEINCQQCGKKITSLPCTYCAMVDFRGEYGEEDYDECDEGELEIPMTFQNQQVMHQQMKFQKSPMMQPPQQQPPQQQFVVQGKRQNRMPLQQQHQQQGFMPPQGFNPMMQQQQFRQGGPQQFGQMPRKMVPQQMQQQRMGMPRQQSSGFQQQFQQHLQRSPQQQMPFRGQMMQQQPRQQLQMQRQGMKQGPQPPSSPLFIKPEPEWEEGQHFPGQQQQMQQFQPGQMPPGQFPQQPGQQQGKKGRSKVQYVPPMPTTQVVQSPKAEKTKNNDDNYDDEEEEEPKPKKKKKGKSKKARSPSRADSPASQHQASPAEQKAPIPSDNNGSQEKGASQDGAGLANSAAHEGSQEVGEMETFIKEEPEWGEG